VKTSTVPAAVDVRNLTKYFGTIAAVHDVSFEIPPGQIVGLVGPPGSGKSTTLRMLTAFIAPTSGTVKVDGFNVHEQRLSALNRVGYVPDNGPLYPDMTPAQMLRFFGEARHLDRTVLKRRLAEIAEACAIADVVNRPMARLSPAARWRVALAQALMHDPSVLIVDEPASDLDLGQLRQFCAQLRAIRGEKTVLVSSAALSDVETLVDRVLALKGGRLVFDGTPVAMQSSRPAGGLRAV
jgi:ABC-2 type transport system ATP-binding protein